MDKTILIGLTKELVGKSLICTRAPPTIGPINPLGNREYHMIMTFILHIVVITSPQ